MVRFSSYSVKLNNIELGKDDKTYNPELIHIKNIKNHLR